MQPRAIGTVKGVPRSSRPKSLPDILPRGVTPFKGGTRELLGFPCIPGAHQKREASLDVR